MSQLQSSAVVVSLGLMPVLPLITGDIAAGAGAGAGAGADAGAGAGASGGGGAPDLARTQECSQASVQVILVSGTGEWCRRVVLESGAEECYVGE